MMGRTLRKQISVYVKPEIKDQIVQMVAESNYNRDTESSISERLIMEALALRRQPTRTRPSRLKSVGV